MQETTRQYRRIEQRHYSAHHTLLHIAELSLTKAEAKEPGWLNEAFICITFSALTIEALANAIGDRVVDDWDTFERQTPKEKIKQLKKLLQVPDTEAPEVWRTIAWLNAFRKHIAHPKPEHIIKETLLDKPIESGSFEAPESKLEKMITTERARESFEAVYEAKRILSLRVPEDDSEGLEIDNWFRSTELILNPINQK